MHVSFRTALTLVLIIVIAFDTYVLLLENNEISNWGPHEECYSINITLFLTHILNGILITMTKLIMFQFI